MAHPDGIRDDGTRSQLEDFLAAVAHEVLSPLLIVDIAVKALTSLEAEPSPDPATRAALYKMVERNVELAILLMNRMALARSVESDEVELSTEVLDLERLVRETVSDLDHTVLNGRDVTFAPSLGLLCDIDATAVREIVFNLLSNAAKYSARAEPITVALDRIGDTARLVIRDHGAGVPAEETEWIFEKFSQGENASVGVGLGLFISRGLARAHGGDITVITPPSGGSEFTLTLPAAA